MHKIKVHSRGGIHTIFKKLLILRASTFDSVDTVMIFEMHAKLSF